MARPLRIEYPGAVYHITSRGNDKKAVFDDDHDRSAFLSALARVNERYHWLCHAYCLMDNHYHLLVETPDGNLSIGMRQLNGVYTQTFNRRHLRAGHLFQGRYKAILLQKDTHLLEACRYIVLNPVRAGMVREPCQWKWSSYSATAGQTRPPACLTISWILSQFSRTKAKAQEEYSQFVGVKAGNGSIWEGVKGQVILGQDEFVEGFSDYLKRHKGTLEIPRSQRFASRPTLAKLFEGSTIKERSKRNRVIREAVEMFGYTQRAVADYLGFHFTYISRILNER